ncbi:MAG: hypothetical protein QOG72_2446 [Sphingomonadales bacterium]|jgi:hypothetical protein|nr:hypothetical protein [Sphingomonadales bacterium]
MTLLDHFAENLSRHGDPAKAAAQLWRSLAWGGGAAQADPRRARGAGAMSRLGSTAMTERGHRLYGAWLNQGGVHAFVLFAGYGLAGAYDGLPLPKFTRRLL